MRSGGIRGADFAVAGVVSMQLSLGGYWDQFPLWAGNGHRRGGLVGRRLDVVQQRLLLARAARAEQRAPLDKMGYDRLTASVAIMQLCSRTKDASQDWGEEERERWPHA